MITLLSHLKTTTSKTDTQEQRCLGSYRQRQISQSDCEITSNCGKILSWRNTVKSRSFESPWGKQKLVWKIPHIEKSGTKLHRSTEGRARNDVWLKKIEAFCLYIAETHFLNTYDSSPSLITNDSSQSTLKLDWLFRLTATDGLLRPFSDPDFPSGILDFWGSKFSVNEFCNKISRYLQLLNIFELIWYYHTVINFRKR